MSPQPGWFPDSNNPQLLRWWDGQQWTEHTHFVQQTYTPAPEQHIPVLSPEPKNKKALSIVLSIIGFFILIFGLGVFWLISSTGVFNNLSDEQVTKIQKQITPVDSNIKVTALTSGTSCEQLCQNFIVRLVLPEDSDDYSGADLGYIINNIPVALDNVNGKKDRVELCFDIEDDMWSLNFSDNDFTTAEKALTDRLTEIGVPKPEYSSPEEGGYNFINGCISVMVEDIR